MASQMIQ